MLTVQVQGREFFIEDTQEIIAVKPCTLRLEHSLISISKWESKWHVPFLADGKKTDEQTLDYIKCMTLNTDVNPLVYLALGKQNLVKIREYIEDPMTASKVFDLTPKNGAAPKKAITSELIYYWMTALNIPFECEKWHINRLLMLIKISEIESNPKKKKMSMRETVNFNRELNEMRKAQLHTTG